MYGQNATAEAGISPVRTGHVTSQMERAQKLTEQLAANLKELDSRLQPILRSSQSQQAGKADATPPKPILVGHAQGLSNHNDQIESAVSFVESILDRIEL